MKNNAGFLFRCLIGAGILLAIIGFPILCQYYPVLEWVGRWQARMASHGAGGAALFTVLFALCNILLLPGGILSIGSGFFFGLWWGFLLVLAGNILGGAVAFLAGRYLFRSWMLKKMAKSTRWLALDAAIRAEGWKIIVLTQLHPLFPTSLLNYLYGATSVRFWQCILWVTAGRAPGIFLYAYLGTLGQHGLRIMRGENVPHTYEIAMWVGGLGVALILSFVLGRIALRVLAGYPVPEENSPSSLT